MSTLFSDISDESQEEFDELIDRMKSRTKTSAEAHTPDDATDLRSMTDCSAFAEHDVGSPCRSKPVLKIVNGKLAEMVDCAE